MSDSDIRGKLAPAHSDPWNVEAQPGHSDLRSPVTGFNCAVQWGLASLLIGCTLVVASCVMLVFSVVLFRGGPAGIPTSLAFAGGLIGALAVSALGLASLVFGIRSWQQAYANRSSPALGIAGVVVSFVGSIVWLIAEIDFLMVLQFFAR